MRPYIICHMLSSVDGKIDGASLSAVMPDDEYEKTGAKLKGDAWICGRTTMQQHFAERKPFRPASHKPAGPQPVHVARRAKSYAICMDTIGKLRWRSGDLDGDLSVLIVPGIDGRHDIPAIFDGVKPTVKKAVPLRLKSMHRRPRGTLWLQYQVRHTNKRNGK